MGMQPECQVEGEDGKGRKAVENPWFGGEDRGPAPETAGTKGCKCTVLQCDGKGIVQDGCLTRGRRIPSNRQMLRHAVELPVIRRHDAIWRRGDASGRFA